MGRAEPALPRPLLRAAPVAAAVQAVADGLRLRPLLPDRALLPRRGCPSRPLSRGTLPVRYRDALRRAGGRLRRRGGTLLRSVSRVHRLASERPSLSPSLPRRGHAAFRHGQAGPALRAGDPGPVPHFRRLLVQAVPGDRRRRWGGPRIVRSQTRGPAALVLRRPRGVRQGIGRPGAGLAHQRGPGHRIDRRGPRTEHDQQHHRGVLSRSGVGGPPHRRIAG